MPEIRYPLHRRELRELLISGDTAIRDAMGPAMRCRDDQVLISAGEEGDTVYLVEHGWAARTRLIEDGRRQIIAVFLPGDLMGIKSMLLERQPDNIECLADVRVRGVDHKRLLELVKQDHGVALRLMFQLGEDERRLHNWMTALGRGDAEERIATLLLDFRGRLSPLGGGAAPNTFRMPITQQEIADHLGLTVVHVNRVLRRLREDRLVTVKQGVVTIGDLPGLSELAAPMQDIYERSRPEFGGSLGLQA
jgi:CRP/FNR family transcriptional regulator, anaerobic regulatory protein